MITPLHNHSMYSSLDGFSTPEEIAERVQQIGGDSAAITDHGVVTGHLHFAKAMTAAGLKPIFGAELYHGIKVDGFKGNERDQAHLIALAQTDQGLRNLWCLANATSDAKHYRHVGRVFWEDLEKYKEGIIFTSACALGLVPQGIVRGDYEAANRYLDILGDNFYIEISTYPADVMFNDDDSDETFNSRIYNEALVAFAAERGVPVIYGDDGHYAFPWQYPFHDIYLARQTKQTIDTPIDERKMYHPADAVVIKDMEMVRNNLSYLPDAVIEEAVNNARWVAEHATAQLPEIRRHLPAFVPVDCPWLKDEVKKLSAEDLFVELVERGIVERYGEDADVEVWQRTLYEVETLLNDGIHHYFLMGWDEIQLAQSLGIERGPGRGSSAGCIVAYALGITDVDPLHYGLIFERFWNSGRAKGFPDIDSDFSRARRQEIITGLKERWGSDRVAAIGTVGYLKPKATIDKMATACGIEFTEAEELKQIVGQTTKIEILGPDQIGWNPEFEPGKKYYVKTDCEDEIEKWISAVPARTDVREYFVQVCEVVCSRVAQYGIHASGIVISDVPLADELPAYRRGGKDAGVPATMFDMESVDLRQFVKLDVLGLRTLDVLEYWRNDMKANHDLDIQWSGLDKEDHPQEMWDLLLQGFTAGIFQVEDGYGRQLCKMMNPSSILDMSALNALNRPGPIQAKIPEEYCARRNGLKPVTYIDSRLEEVLDGLLEETYGLFVYQEQIINYFNALDYTKSESDGIRKIMGKKKPEEMDGVRDGLGEWEGRGYLSMAEAAGIPSQIAEKVWLELEGFADYCFNKSHAVAYGIVGFRTLFAKYYGPAEFYAACIRSLDPSTDAKKRKEMLPQFINECRRQGIPVAPPHIKHSRGYPYVTEDGTLYFGFSDIATVKSSGDYIVQLRDEQELNMDSAEEFQVAFEAYNEDWNVRKQEGVAQGLWDSKIRSPKQRLTSNKIAALEKVGVWETAMTLTKRQQVEQEMLGVILTDNTSEVFERHQNLLDGLNDYDNALTPFEEKFSQTEPDEDLFADYSLPGVVCGIQEKFARKNGVAFGIVDIEFNSDAIQFIVGAKQWKTFKAGFKMRTPGVFTIRHLPPNEYGECYTYLKAKALK